MDASIWFNKQCQTYHITPKYAQIHLKDNNTCNIKTNIFRTTPIQTAIKPTNTNIKHDVVDNQNTTKYLFAKCLCTR